MGLKKHNWRNVGVLLGTPLPNPSGITGVMLWDVISSSPEVEQIIMIVGFLETICLTWRFQAHPTNRRIHCRTSSFPWLSPKYNLSLELNLSSSGPQLHTNLISLKPLSRLTSSSSCLASWSFSACITCRCPSWAARANSSWLWASLASASCGLRVRFLWSICVG